MVQVRTEALVNNVWAAAVLIGLLEPAERHLIKLIGTHFTCCTSTGVQILTLEAKAGMHPQLSSLYYSLALALSAQGRLQEPTRPPTLPHHLRPHASNLLRTFLIRYQRM
jgi:hypothetical protein